MATFPDPEENPSLLGRIFKYKVLIVILFLIVLGILFLIIAQFSEPELAKHLLRDVGIVLFTTGLVVFAAESVTRKEFLALLATELDPLKREMVPLRTDMCSLTSNLLQSITPLRQDIPTLSTALNEIRTCISLGAAMSVLGIKQIHKDRWQSDLLSKLENAAAQTEIKILGMVASEVSEPMIKEAIMQKLKEGCNFKILCLNPASSFADLRALEEDRDVEEMRLDILSRIAGWKNFVEHRIPEAMRSKVELRCYDSTPSYFLFITGTLVVVGFYLGITRGATGPHLELEVKHGGIATAFIQHFDTLWETAKAPPSTSVAIEQLSALFATGARPSAAVSTYPHR